MLALTTLKIISSGVLQHSPPDGDTVSQFTPPLVPTAWALKVKADPFVVTGNTCGNGLAPPNGITKVIGST